jgi:RNA polymerase sigma factor for flagellar operon FliA
LLNELGFVIGVAGAAFGVVQWRQGRAIQSQLNKLTVLLGERATAERVEVLERDAGLASVTNDELAEAIAELPEQEKLLVTLYYYEELTLREIAEVLGITESRASQLHTSAVLRLKSRLA